MTALPTAPQSAWRSAKRATPAALRKARHRGRPAIRRIVATLGNDVPAACSTAVTLETVAASSRPLSTAMAAIRSAVAASMASIVNCSRDDPRRVLHQRGQYW